jgi:hypothetical protein
MTKRKLPWEKRGYRFSIDWPPGFEPQPYEPPWRASPEQLANLRKGSQVTNKNTGRKYYGKARGSKATQSGPLTRV